MKDRRPLRTEDRWLLAIMGMFPYIEGRTMLQKFGMLSFYEVLKDEEFFDDWKAEKYGGFSTRLAASLRDLEASGYVRSDEAITARHDIVNRYSLTEAGRQEASGFREANLSKLEAIRRILSHYHSRPLRELLKDVYQRYPHLTANSKIIADVNRAADSGPYRGFESGDLPQSDQEAGIRAQVSAGQHVLGDMDFRRDLAESIGLRGVPDLDPRAFDRVGGLLSEQLGPGGFDARESVRDVRDW
ncbi:MAG: hypothetical protein J4F28_08800 [Nitrosopumilaceae archaeon]|nr:hypothetical protein [Nitrosopumilaceae archaeon]